MNAPRILNSSDIALAMELITEGYQRQHIAAVYGVCAKTLSRSIRYAEEFGMRKEAAPVCSGNRITQVNHRAAQRIRAGSGNAPAIGKKTC